MVNWKYFKNKSTVLYLAPESECAIIQFFWLGIARYGDFHLSACRKKFDSLLLGLCITRTLSDIRYIRQFSNMDPWL